MEIITYSELQQKFDSATENSSNRKMAIEFEISAIEDYVNNIPYFSPFRGKPQATRINKSPKIFNFENVFFNRIIFNEAFYEYLNNGKAISIIQEQNDNIDSLRIKQSSVEQAIEFFKYYQWLKNQLTTNTKAKPSISLNHQEKMLALHYLGMNTKNFDDTKTAKILSAILGLNEQNTREILGALYINAVNNPVRTKKHLENLKQHFETLGLTEISDKIKGEILELK